MSLALSSLYPFGHSEFRPYLQPSLMSGPYLVLTRAWLFLPTYYFRTFTDSVTPFANPGLKHSAGHLRTRKINVCDCARMGKTCGI